MSIYFEELSIGAQRTIELFWWFGARGCDCYPTLKWLAEKLMASPRSVCRWTAELSKAGAIRKKLRGPHSALYVLLWKKPWKYRQRDLFPPEDNSCENVVNGDSLASLSAALPLYELEDGKTMRGSGQTLPVEKENQTPEPLAQEQGFSPTEKQAVAKAVESHRRPGGEGFVCSGALLRRLERIAGFYQFNGFQVASELERVRRQDLESRSRWPEKDGWFCAVLEARLKRRERKPVQREERGGAVFLGWSAEELRALDQGVEAGAQSVECDPKPVSRDLPVAQPKAPERRTDPGEREWCDTGALISGIAAGKSLIEATGWKRPESLEALHQAVEEKKWPGAA